MIEGLDAFRLRYRDARGEWSPAWPPPLGPDARPDALPRAVEFSLQLQDLGEIVRLVELPEAPR